MKQDIKVIAMDLDGTALNHQKQLTERTRAAIQNAAKSGIQIVVATGRTFSSLAPEVLAMPEITCAITSNGAVVNQIPDGAVLLHNYPNPETVSEIAGMIQKEKIDTEVCTGGQAYIGQSYYDRVLEGKTNRDVQYVKTTRHPVPDIYQFLLEHRVAIENINLNFKTLEEKQQWQQRFQKLPGVTPTSSFLFNVELGGATTSKAHALQALLDEWQMTSQQVMAFGDSENDLGMIQMAGIGVAMANGMEEVKQAADLLAESNEEDGVAKIIEQLIVDI
ncbi:MAG: HAD family hydrolase [Lachnospiraceae bacterium]|nr:HAD family hydrolase [Lachnospiraceae bacterium]MDD7434798.1 HAD family hydrolase [Lachnospiraceae bacterium]MDY3341822.1 HAD family hydrolase [Lachnospiraceae bacterium]